MALPLADPQFWLVTNAAAAALALILRRLFKRPKANSMPCAHCTKAGLGNPPRHPR